MCETANSKALRNGKAADPETQGHALADIIDSLSSMETRLKELPTRHEVLDIVEQSLNVHISTCASARSDKKQTMLSKFHLGKGGLDAEGSGGIVLGAFLGIVLSFIVYVVAPYLKQWLELYFAK